MATEKHPNLKGRVLTLGAYGVTVASAGAALYRWGRPLPDRIGVYDIGLLALATHKTSRTLTKDAVTAPLRAPFTEPVDAGGPGEVNEKVTAPGEHQHTLGELLTCPFCMSQWVATGFTVGLLLAPRPTRIAMTVMSVRALSDALQLGYAAAQQALED